MWNSGSVSYIINVLLFVPGIFKLVDRNDLDFAAIMGGVIDKGEEGGRMYLKITHIFEFYYQKKTFLLAYTITGKLSSLHCVSKYDK